MLKQMCWLPGQGTNRDKILHLRTNPQQGWQPYTHFPDCAVPDCLIPGASRGYATYQVLRSRGWCLIPSSQAYHLASIRSERFAS